MYEKSVFFSQSQSQYFIVCESNLNTPTHICASVSGVLHESNWDTAKLCRGVEQPWVCVQRSGRNMAGYTPLWKGTTCNGFWVLKGQPGFCFLFNVRFCLGRCELRNKRREMGSRQHLSQYGLIISIHSKQSAILNSSSLFRLTIESFKAACQEKWKMSYL